MADLLDQIADQSAGGPTNQSDLLDQVADQTTAPPVTNRQPTGFESLGAAPVYPFTRPPVPRVETPVPSTSSAGAFARSAAPGVIPGFAAAYGGKKGFEWGKALATAWRGARIGGAAGEIAGGGPEDPIADVLGLGGMVVGALIASTIADKAQSETLKAASPQLYNQLQTFQQQDLQNHPLAVFAGNIAGSLPAFRLQNPLTTARAASAIIKIARGQTVQPAEMNLAKNLATQVGLGTAQGIIAPLTQGQTPTFGDVSQSVAQFLLFGEPRKFGVKAPTIESEKSNATRIQQEQESGRTEYPSGNEGGETPETGGSNRPVGPAPVAGQTPPPLSSDEVGRLAVTAARILITRGVEPDVANRFANWFVKNTGQRQIGEQFRNELNQAFDKSGLLDKSANTYSDERNLRAAAQANDFTEEQIQAGVQKRADRDREIADLNRKKIEEISPAPKFAQDEEMVQSPIMQIGRIAGMTPDEFLQFVKGEQPGEQSSMTRKARELGMSVTSPHEVSALLNASKQFKDFRAAFFNQAYQAATGTGGEGAAMSKDPNYKPPFPLTPPAVPPVAPAPAPTVPPVEEAKPVTPVVTPPKPVVAVLTIQYPAVRYRKGVFPVQPGENHDDTIARIRKTSGDKAVAKYPPEKGFVDSKGNFISDRTKAADIAKAAGQIPNEITELHSEDFWKAKGVPLKTPKPTAALTSEQAHEAIHDWARRTNSLILRMGQVTSPQLGALKKEIIEMGVSLRSKADKLTAKDMQVADELLARADSQILPWHDAGFKTEQAFRDSFQKNRLAENDESEDEFLRRVYCSGGGREILSK